MRELFRRLSQGLINNNIVDVGAMMAYYAILALFPMLVFVATLALLIVPDSVLAQGVAMATATMPRSVRELVSSQVTSLTETTHAGFAIGSALVALWGASRGAASLSGALNAMYNKTETRSWLRRQLIAIAVTLGVAVMVVLALALLVVGPWIGHAIADHFALGDTFDTIWSVGRWGGAGVLVMLIWAVVYKTLPDTRAPFRIFTPGAAIGVLLWLGVSWLFGVYLGHFNSYEATYGALGGGVIFLTWLWLSNVALLFGAEINGVLAIMRRHRSTAARLLADEDDRARAEQGDHAKAA